MSVFSDINTDLDLNGPFLAFTTQPPNTTVDNGASASLTVVVSKTFTNNPSPTDSGTLLYEWFEKIPGQITLNSLDPLIDYRSLVGVDNFSGQTTDTLVLSSAQNPYETADFTNNFKCKVTYQLADRYASGTIIKGTGAGRNEPIVSDAAIITVNPELRIVTTPPDKVALENVNASFEVVVSTTDIGINTRDLSYKWYFVNRDGSLSPIVELQYSNTQGTVSQVIEYVDGIATTVSETIAVREAFTNGQSGDVFIESNATDITFELSGGQGGSGATTFTAGSTLQLPGGGSNFPPLYSDKYYRADGYPGSAGRYGSFIPASGKEDEFRGKTFRLTSSSPGGNGGGGGGTGFVNGGNGGNGTEGPGGGGGGASGLSRSDGTVMVIAGGGAGGGGGSKIRKLFFPYFEYGTPMPYGGVNNVPFTVPQNMQARGWAGAGVHNGVVIQSRTGDAGESIRTKKTNQTGGGGGGGGAGCVGSSTYAVPVGLGGESGIDYQKGTTAGRGGGSGYRSDFLELVSGSQSTGAGDATVSYNYIKTTTTTKPGTSVVIPVAYTNYQYITYSGVTSSTLTVNARYVQSERPAGYFDPTRQLKCIVSHPTATNSPITVPDPTSDDNGILFTVAESLGNVIYVEQISASMYNESGIPNVDINDGINLIEASLNNSLVFETLGSKTDSQLSPYLYRFYCLSDTEVNISLYGGAGEAYDSFLPGFVGRGSYAKIKVKLEANTEYIIAGLDPFVNNPFIYKKAKLIAAAGQGGGSGTPKKNGTDGKAVDTRNFAARQYPIGGQLGGSCGYYDEASNPYPGKVLFGNAANYPNASTSIFGPTSRISDGVTPKCTIGDYESGLGYSPCNDLPGGHLTLQDGTKILSTRANLSTGYKMGFVDGVGCLLTGGAGQYSTDGPGGNGFRGGLGGQNSGGNGGYGYINTGLCELIESQDGVNSGVARVVIENANVAETPLFEYIIVAGGGGGAYQYGGGGGGGGMVHAGYNPAGVDNPPKKLYIYVGSGGSKGTSTTSAQNGENSTIFSTSGDLNVTTFGGGAGGATGAAGAGGGSGGGGGPGTGSQFAFPGGAGYQSALFDSNAIYTQGVAGGQGYSGDPPYPGGGGGGGANGWGVPRGQPPISGDKTSNFDEPGRGGNGRTDYITGSPVTYAGGGGGGQFYDDSVGLVLSGGVGGTGGGGNGGLVTTLIADLGVASRTPGDGTGGLGGGGGGGGARQNGGNGGSGVVIISFPDTFPDALAVATAGGLIIKSVSTGNRIYTFYGDGTLEFQ